MYFNIIVFLSLLNIFKFFDILKINSLKETKINLNKDKRYIIYEFSTKTLDFQHKNFAVILYPILHIYFKKGYQINTIISIYYQKEDIQLENTKFINTNYSSDLYNINKIWIKSLKSEKIYIVVSNFKSNNYEDAITIFNSLEYPDISKINKARYDIYFSEENYGFSNKYFTFSINNTNLNYSYIHYIGGLSLRFIHTDDMEYIRNNNNIISLKEYKNKIIYFCLFEGGKSSSHFPIYLETSNYSLLYPLTDIENRTFSHELFGENWQRIYLFINITDYPPTFYFNISQVICIDYYFFETDVFELIESKIPFIEGGIRANTKDLYFSIQKNDNSSIGLVLKIEIENDIIFIY